MAGPTREFWEKRFQAGDTPWDRGAANPQLGGVALRGRAEALPHPRARLRLGPRSRRAGGGGFRGDGARLRARGDRPHAQTARSRGAQGNARRRPTRSPGSRTAPSTRSTSRPACARCIRTSGATTPTSCTAGSRRAASCTRSSSSCSAGRRRGRDRGPALPLRHQRDARAVSRKPLGVAEAALSAHGASARARRTCRDFGPAKLGQASSMRSR